MLSLSQRLSQQQKLSPQQIQYQKLLQLNTLALEQRIKTELELNPILEEIIEEEPELTQELDSKEKEDGLDEVEEEFDDFNKDEFELEDFMNDVDFEADRANRSQDDETYQPLAPAKESLNEHLRNQLAMLDLSDDLYLLGEEIIGNLDADGYLKGNLSDILEELEMFEHIKISAEEAEALLKKIQTFDPVGIACRSLQ
jgi:RNA polymerase sigma-54 factor